MASTSVGVGGLRPLPVCANDQVDPTRRTTLRLRTSLMMCSSRWRFALLLLRCRECHGLAVGQDATHEHPARRTVAHRTDRECDLVTLFERVLRPAAPR